MSYQKFIRQTACLGSCRGACEERKLLAQQENVLALDERTWVSLNLDKDSFCH